MTDPKFEAWITSMYGKYGNGGGEGPVAASSSSEVCEQPPEPDMCYVQGGLSIQVVDGNGKPIPRVQLQACETGETAVTDKHGAAGFQGLRADQDAQIAVAFDGVGYTKPISDRKNLKVVANKTTMRAIGYSTVPKTFGDLVVQVLDKLGNPVFEAFVKIGKTTMRTNAKGHVDFGRLPAGLTPAQITAEFEKKVTETHMVQVEANKTSLAKVKLSVASNRMVDDISDEDFWKDLEDEVQDRIGRWLDDHWAVAIENMDTYLHKKPEESTEKILWSATNGILAKIPGAEIPIMIVNTGLELAKFLPSETTDVESFLTKARNAKSTVGNSVKNRKHPAILKVRELKGGPKADDEEYRAKVEKSVRKEVGSLPSKNAILRAMASDWLKAAKDTDIISRDYEGPEAGYLYCVMNYKAKSKKLTSSKPTLDDIENPGMLNALKEGYGASSPVTSIKVPTKGILNYYTDTRKEDDKEGYVAFVMEGTGPGKFKVQSKAKHHLPFYTGTPSWMPSDAEAVKIFTAKFKTYKVKDVTLE